jgi:DNA processing protein
MSRSPTPGEGGPKVTGWLDDDEARPTVLRRPRDLANEMRGPGSGRTGRRTAGATGNGEVDELPLAWPDDFATSPLDREAVLVLASLPSLTPRALLALAARHRTAGACLGAVCRGEAGSTGDVERARLTDPADVAQRVGAASGRFVIVGDDAYPHGLVDLADPPMALFVRGLDLPEAPAVAIVGSRTPSPAGEEMAGWLARDLVAAGCTVVSGGALGIDAASHRAALAAAGSTIAVLGCGIDVVYPKTNRDLFERLGVEGTVLSEYPPGTPPEPFRFPARNRLVAALSTAVVVVEGAAGSGSLITAEHAMELGRPVFAVPGPVSSDLSAAPHQLIRDGAGLIRGPDDLLQELDLHLGGTARGPVRPGGVTSAQRAIEGLPKEAAIVLAEVRGATPPEVISSRTGMPAHRVLALLMRLELVGLVREAGGRYERTVTEGSAE